MKKTPLRKKGKTKISVLQRKIWELCKQIVRKKYGNTCYTCGRSGITGSNWHTSHMWAKASLGAYLKYDLRILRPACYNCNINLGGQGAIFYERMLKENGQEYMDQMKKDRQTTVNAYQHYEKILKEYEELWKTLKE